jgi:4-amino-4-deoxy-L-arabinose transferase-like glycosyltransferase
MSTTRRHEGRRRASPSRGASAALLSRSRGALARIPTAAWVCALLAFVNAACWSVITPPFLALDEPDHFAYVQQLAETGRLPSSAASEYSPEEQLALRDLRHEQVRFRPAGNPIFSTAEQRKLQADLAQSPSRVGPGGAGVAASEPPLYYALETIPYALGSSGSILDRLELMRLLSAVLAGLTVLFVFLFLREALPSVSWAWTVGGLGVALAPLLGFASSTVNPDALLFTVSAAVFYCLARAFRRGLTQRSAIAIGVLIAVGLVTKLNFAGLAPGAVLGLVLLTRREAHASGRRAYYRLLAPALAIAVSPGVLYALVNIASNHHTFGIVSSGVAGLASAHRSLSGELSYIWQFYLPRLPWMHNDFGEIFTTRQIWFRNTIGLYGWGDTAFPAWVYDFALVPVVPILALCARELASRRMELARRATELFAYAAMAVGVLVLVGASGYLLFPGTVAEFTDARYLLPMVGLWGAALALAARGAGARWGPPVGALIVVLVFTHDLFSQLQVIARYYG